MQNILNSELTFPCFTVLAYLLGCVPNGLIVARFRGVDIRKVGSGNIGATNVFRSIGKGPGLLTFFLDALKGFAPSFGFPALLVYFGVTVEAQAGLLFGCAAIAGHTWPVFLRFKGGKGVATSAGMLLGVAPEAMGLGLAGWILIFLCSGFVSLASMGAALMAAAAGWFLYRDQGILLPAVLTLLCCFIFFTHRSNIRRLAAGKENRFNLWKRKSNPRQ